MSIATTLGVGSGIDTTALVTSLVAAQREAKDTALKTKSDKVTAQISGISQLKSGITNFSTALNTLITGGMLKTRPTSSNADIISVSGITGATPGSTTSLIEVKGLAASQSVASKAFASADAAVGTGKLTFTFGNATVTDGVMSGFAARTIPAPITVDIDTTNNTLTGIATAINAQKSGMTASVVTDDTGARLVIKGATGASQAFTIAATEDSGAPGLAQLEYNATSTTSTLNQAATDAVLTVDGLTVRRSSNTISDLIPGTNLTLNAVSTSKVSVGATRPISDITTAVSDFVAAYNEVQAIITEQTNVTTGSLNNDAAVRQMKLMLSKLTSTRLVAGGSPSTLAEIGVSTNRDGTLSLDSAKLTAAANSNPAALEAMFNPNQTSSSALVQIISPVSATKAGTYTVTDLVAATRGRTTGAANPNAFDTPVMVDSTNNRFSVAMDGKAAVDVTVPEGSYADGASFAAALNAAIENSASVTIHGDVTWEGDSLVFSSKTPGILSAMTVTPTDGTLSDRLGLTTTTRTSGTNAAGKISGVAAIGSAGLLFGTSASGSSGLILQPLAGASSTTISVDKGLYNALNDITLALTRTDGALYSANARLAKEQASIADDRKKVDDSATKMKELLTKQFAAMDSKVAAYKSTQSFLTQQIDAWNNSNN